MESFLSSFFGCSHDYVLRPQDLLKLTKADVLVVNGLGLEKFLGKSLAHINPRLRVIEAGRGVEKSLYIRAAVQREWLENQAGYDLGELNPHTFASPREAAQMVRYIGVELGQIDPDNIELYNRNAARYAAEMEKLVDVFRIVVATFPVRKIATEHSVFDYLARDVGLDIVAVVEKIPGWEPAASQILDLVKIIKKSGVAALFIEPQYKAKIGRAVGRESGVPVAVLDPVAGGPSDTSLDYYQQAMRQNIETLKSVLGHGQN
ncbi:High-affinity zinc uptake system binding-protein ZnuA [Desulfovibrionales bacterium]